MGLIYEMTFLYGIFIVGLFIKLWDFGIMKMTLIYEMTWD